MCGCEDSRTRARIQAKVVSSAQRRNLRKAKSKQSRKKRVKPQMAAQQQGAYKPICFQQKTDRPHLQVEVPSAEDRFYVLRQEGQCKGKTMRGNHGSATKGSRGVPNQHLRSELWHPLGRRITRAYRSHCSACDSTHRKRCYASLLLYKPSTPQTGRQLTQRRKTGLCSLKGRE